LEGGGTEAGVRSPHLGNRVRGETFKAESETADLWQPKWNAVLAAAIHTPDRDIDPLEGTVAGSWSSVKTLSVSPYCSKNMTQVELSGQEGVMVLL